MIGMHSVSSVLLKSADGAMFIARYVNVYHKGKVNALLSDNSLQWSMILYS